MSDQANTGGAAAGGQETITSTTPPAGAAGAPGTGGDTGATGLSTLAADTSGDLTAPASWPDDWRERWAGGDEKELARLKRFASPENVYKAAREVERKFSATRPPPTLPENPTEEQVAEYRKAIGIPEKPEDYGIAFDASLKPTDADKEMLNGFLSHMHGRNIPPAVAKEAFNWYQQSAIQQREALEATAQRERARVTTELRKEYGAEYKKNLALADEWLAAHPGVAKYVRPDNPDLEFVKDIIKLARDSAPEEVLFSGDGDAGGKSLDEQLDELTQKSIRGKLSSSEKAKYDQLTAAAVKREERARGRAA
jgi:hypothetical protein